MTDPTSHAAQVVRPASVSSVENAIQHTSQPLVLMNVQDDVPSSGRVRKRVINASHNNGNSDGKAKVTWTVLRSEDVDS